MWTGTSALKNINQSLQTLRNEVVRLDVQLSQLTETMGANQRHRVKIINDIAKVRLAEIESGELQASLTAADQEAASILQKRESVLQALNDEINQLNQGLAALEDAREALLYEVNETSQNIVDAEQQVQQGLKQDSSYLAQFARASEAQNIADEAHRKVEQAQQDMAEKAKPYQSDDLFMYLWQRGYGTTEYNGRLFARFLDGRVARLIKYEQARVNYWNLTEIPKRLQQHADSVSNQADEAHMALQQLELDALAAAGTKQLDTELQKLRDGLDKKDDELEASENLLNQKLAVRTSFVAGDDEYIKASVKRLSQALNHNDLSAIHRYVRDTHSPTDDQLVIELQGLDDKLADVEEDLSDLRVLHNARLSKLQELEKVRRNFKNSRFDDVRSGFGNEGLLASALAQFIQGSVSGKDLWRTIKRNQRYRNVGSIPDFGSGGLGNIGDILGGGVAGRQHRSGRNSTWHWPSPRRGGGGFKLPRSSGSRGGGGGGFKTGGGF